MAELLEHLWNVTQIAYPANAHVPRRDTLALQQMREDDRRRTTVTTIDEYVDRRRMSLGRQPRRSSLLKEFVETNPKFKELTSVKSGEEGSLGYDVDTAPSVPPSVPSAIAEKDEVSTDKMDTLKPEDETQGSRRSSVSTVPSLYKTRKRKFGMMHQQESVFSRKNYPIVIHSEFHRVMFDFCESRTFSGFILVVILLNTAMLIAQTVQVVQVRCGWYFGCIDNVFLGIYIYEMVLKLYVWRFKYFYEGWNWLDFTIVVFNLIDFMLPLVIQNFGQFNGAAIFRILRIFRAIRALRALRVLRTIRFLANLQVIMTTILQSIRSIGAIVMLILLFMYMFAVIGRGLYASVDPAHFGNLLYASFTLFQLLTLDDWFDIYIHISNADPTKWHVILYLLAYIVVEYFIFLNLFVAVLVDNFHLTIEAQNVAIAKKKDAQDLSDEEADNQGLESGAMSDSSMDSDASDDLRARKGVEEFYPEMMYETRERLKQYFRIRAALGYNMQVLAEQERILAMMVDLCAESKHNESVM